MMDRMYVESSAIESIGYDTENAILEVEFKRTHAVWQYLDVPENVWYDFQSSSSLGHYFSVNIRNQYPEVRVN